MFQPGVNGIVPQLTSDPHRANATIRAAGAVAELLGSAAAGILVSVFGAGGPTLWTPRPSPSVPPALAGLRMHPVARAKTSTLTDLVAGRHESRARTWLWSVILVWAAFGIFPFGPLIPLGAVLVDRHTYGWMQSAAGAGTILGGLAALRAQPRRPLAAGAVLMVGYPLLPLAIALHRPLPPLLLAAGISGIAWAFWSIMWQTSVQTAMLNRVTSYEVLGSDGSLPIGQALAGPVAGAVGAERVLGTSVVVGLLGCVALLLIPAVRNLGRAPAPDDVLTRSPAQVGRTRLVPGRSDRRRDAPRTRLPMASADAGPASHRHCRRGPSITTACSPAITAAEPVHRRDCFTADV
ncbi:putative MFS transporter [Actinoplanes sp. N902-109]|nr:putative MFS transporter [Actinoplanes sp. N902-109]